MRLKEKLHPLTTIIALLSLIGLSSCGVRYVPVKTPQNQIEERQKVITEQFKTEFDAKGLKYQALKFGQSLTIKPASHYYLDSLYEIKYNLEQRQTINKKLEQQIAVQQQVVMQDTNHCYYVEKHLFGVEESGQYWVYLADVQISDKNEILAVTMLQSDQIDRTMTSYYTSLALEESFIYPDTYPEESELAFYRFYKEKIDELSGDDRTQFIGFTLRLMQIARKGKNLDKSYLIRKMTTQYVQGTARNYLDERFNNLEELYDGKDNLMFYRIEYAYAIKDDQNNYSQKFCVVLLDPYLQLVEINQVK